MRQIGKVLKYMLLAVNALFAGWMLAAAYCPLLHPAAHPWLSSLGLTFPIVLVINVCFLAMWLILQLYKAALLPVLTLLCCVGDIQTLFPIHLSRPDPPQGSISLLSYNIMGFSGCRKGEQGNAILHYLKESHADLLCLQEYATGSDRKRHITQQDVESELKEYPYHVVTHIGNAKSHTNKLACFSKFPILSAQPITYGSSYNGSVVYRIRVGKDTLTVVNNHLESNKLTKQDKVVYEELLTVPEKEKMRSGMKHLIKKLAEASVIRAHQADTLAHYLSGVKHGKVIVCGDFNDIPLSYTYHAIARCGLTDAFAHAGLGAGISYNQHRFYFRIDHILTGKELESYRCYVDRSIKESDHYPIRSFIKMRDEE